MTTASFITRTPHIVRALTAIHGKHTDHLAETVRGRIDCPRCRGTLTYYLSSSRRATGSCSASGCVRFDQ